MRTIVLAVLAVLAAAKAGAGQTTAHRLDDSQPRAFLRFLEAVAQHRDARPLVDTLLASPGTGLVIAQQNVVRRVTAAEYREILLAVAEEREPRLEYDGNDPRSAKGAEGLVRDVLPALRWGAAHVDLLASRLTALAALDVDASARQLALANLPEPVSLDVPLFLVMGGRAGAAATTGGIYFDVLVTSVRSQNRYPTPSEIVEYFAHEMHHVGLEQILEGQKRGLHLDEAGERALGLVSGLVAEGSATYLINGHRDLAAMRVAPSIAAPGTDGERLATVERVLTGVLENGWDAHAYDGAMMQLAGNALHMTGATMLDAIWRAEGRAGVMVVMRDPRQLLSRYDASVAATTDAFRFPEPLARRIASLGA